MDVDALDLKKLRAFQLVARHGSLRAAASRLHVTVSAVSFAIRRLEKSLGINLFERYPNKLVLTAAGHRFAHSVDCIFEGINQALAGSALKGVSVSRLSVAVNSDLVWYFIPRISTFLQRYPDVELRIHIVRSTDALRMVQSGEVDVGIGRFLTVPQDVETKTVVESSISAICVHDHPLARIKWPRLEDLTCHKVVTLPERHSTRETINTVFANAGLRVHGYIEVGNCQTVADIVEAGIGIGLVHSLCTLKDVGNTLYRINLKRHFGTLTFSMVHRKNPAVSPFFLEMLKDSLSASST